MGRISCVQRPGPERDLRGLLVPWSTSLCDCVPFAPLASGSRRSPLSAGRKLEGWTAAHRLLSMAVFAGVFLLVSTSLAAPELSLGTAAGLPGSTVNVPVSFLADGTVAGAQFDVGFDPARLTPQTPLKGTALLDHGLSTHVPSAGTLRIVVASFSGAPLQSGTLVSIPFTIDSGAPAGEVPLSFSGVVLSTAGAASVVPTGLQPGSITVTSNTPTATLTPTETSTAVPSSTPTATSRPAETATPTSSRTATPTSSPPAGSVNALTDRSGSALGLLLVALACFSLLRRKASPPAG